MYIRPLVPVAALAVLIASSVPAQTKDVPENPQGAVKAAPDPADFCPWETKIEAAVYKLTIPAEKLEVLDSAALEEASSHKELCQKLKSVGNAQPISMVRQTIKMEESPTIQIGASRPTPTGSSRYKEQVATQVSYQDTGMIFRLTGYWLKDEPKTGYVQIDFEISYLETSPVQVGPSTFAPIFHRVTQQIAGPVRSGKPLVALSADTTGPYADSDIHVVWIRFERTKVDEADDSDQ